MVVGRIYLLRAGGSTYVGSTLRTLEERLKAHLACKDGRRIALAVADNPHAVSIHLLDEGEFDTIEDLEYREGLWQLELEPDLNMTLAGGERTRNELLLTGRPSERQYAQRFAPKGGRTKIGVYDSQPCSPSPTASISC